MSLVLFRVLKPSAPGVPSAENPNARNYFLLQNEGGDSSGKFHGKVLCLYKIPRLEPR